MNTSTAGRNRSRKALGGVNVKSVVAISGLAALAAGATIIAPSHAGGPEPMPTSVKVGIREVPQFVNSVKVEKLAGIPVSPVSGPQSPVSAPQSPVSAPQSPTGPGDSLPMPRPNPMESKCAPVTPGAKDVTLPEDITVTPPVRVVITGFSDSMCSGNPVTITIDTLTPEENVTDTWFVDSEWRSPGQPIDRGPFGREPITR